MINDGINDVPENTIVLFKDENKMDGREIVKSFKEYKKRDWFNPHFYNCLPLTIANQQGFYIYSDYDIVALWNGGPQPEDLQIDFSHCGEILKEMTPLTISHFGRGIITLSPNFMIRTPPKVNILVMPPPNVIIENITHLMAVVETDNLRYGFTFNLKVQQKDVPVFIKKGTPLAAFMPIPRYFADSFTIKNSEDVFSKEIIDEEIKAAKDFTIMRQQSVCVTKQYKKGVDIYGNKFLDHQPYI